MKKVNSKDKVVIDRAKKITKEKFPDSLKLFIAELIMLIGILFVIGWLVLTLVFMALA